MVKFENSIMIDRPAELVWKSLTELSGFQKLDQYILEAKQTSVGPLGVGTTFQLRRSRTPKAPSFRVTEYEPAARKITLEFASGPVKGTRQQLSMETIEGKTRLTRSFDLKYAGFYRLVGPLLTRSAKRESTAQLANVKRIMESEPQS